MSDDLTPEGAEIETTTLWLAFPEGESAISLDTTSWNSAIQRANDALPRGKHGPTADYGEG